MDVFKNSKGSLCTMNVLMIKLVVWLGWLSCVAVGQLELSEAVAGFVNFPEVGISCIGNLAVLITSISKGRLDLELGVRDVLASIRGPNLKSIHGIGLSTCDEFKDASVIMLSYNTPTRSIKHFMKYISNAHKVHSVLLKCFPLKSAELVDDICNCSSSSNHTCKCIVFCTAEEITPLLDSQMPLKRLSGSQCLLPSAGCLRNGCHGCNEGNMAQSGDTDKGKAEVEFVPVFEIPVDYVQEKHTCICIPVHRAADDKWTKLLITSFRSKDNADRGVSVLASDAMENYTEQATKDTYLAEILKKKLRKGLIVKFHTPSLILPRLTEILINILLTGWFRVDGLSTAMVARKAVKSYVVGSEENGFAANAFLSTALVMSADSKSNDNDTPVRHVCQVLTFRRSFLSLRTLSFTAGTVNLLCAIFWIVCTAIRPAKKWYAVDSVPPSEGIRVVVIIVGIAIALVMDCLHLYLGIIADREELIADRKKPRPPTDRKELIADRKEPRPPTDRKEPRPRTSDVPEEPRPRTADVPEEPRPPTADVPEEPRPRTSDAPEDRRPTSAESEWRRLIKRVARPPRERVPVLAVIILEMACVVSGSVAAGVRGEKVFGKWVYSAVQALVWVKWGIGSYLLGESPAAESNSAYNWGSGVLVYSSAFFLNSMLAGVRCAWKYSPSQH